MTYSDETTRKQNRSSESTETIVKRHVKIHVEKEIAPIRDQMKDYSDATQTMVAKSLDQLKAMHEVQGAHHETLYGKMPPTDEDPGIWRMVTDLHKQSKNWSKIKWAVLIAIATGAGATIWSIISAALVQAP